MLLGQIYRAGIGTAIDEKQAYASVGRLPRWKEAILQYANEIRPFAISPKATKQAAVAQAHEMLIEIKRQTASDSCPEVK